MVVEKRQDMKGYNAVLVYDELTQSVINHGCTRGTLKK